MSREVRPDRGNETVSRYFAGTRARRDRDPATPPVVELRDVDPDHSPDEERDDQDRHEERDDHHRVSVHEDSHYRIPSS